MEHLIIFFANLIRAVLGIAARRLRRRVRKLFKQRWSEVPARIDIVSVFEQPEPSPIIKTYIGMLTYFYRNPDLHTGDYAAEFRDPVQAETWVQQFKGRSVAVRVNPRNLEDSVLLQLPAVSAAKSHWRVVPLTVRRPPEPVKVERLSPGHKTLAEYSQLVSMAGLGATLVVLCLSIATGGQAHSRALDWLGEAILLVMLVSLATLSFRITEKHSVRTLRRFYASWCPAEARRFLMISGPVLVTVFLLSMDRLQIPAETRAKLGVHLPWFAGAWGFLMSWTLHTAILRSQNVAAHHESSPRTP